MIVERKVLHNVSLSAHPKGCALYVDNQIDWVLDHIDGTKDKRYPPQEGTRLPKRVVILGGSTGYGLSSRIVAAFAGHADTLNISFEREPTEKRTASPGWYNTREFEKRAKEEHLKAASLFGDAFSDETKRAAGDLIRAMFGQVDLVVYSLASPMRIDPETGETYRSVIKPIGKPFEALTVDMESGLVDNVTVEPATSQQVADTIKVMGGEDWERWIDFLLQENLFAPSAMTVAYSYIGPKITYPVYREGTIGKAKEDLEKHAASIGKRLEAIGGKAYVSVNKALVTRASAVIPVVPLYMALLYKVMKEQEVHEHCTQQMYRLFLAKLYGGKSVPTDRQGRIRMDDWELSERIQTEVERRWALQTAKEQLKDADLAGIREEYDHIHGFGFPSIDYTKECDPR